MPKIEPIQEAQDLSSLKERMAKLPKHMEAVLLQEIAGQVCYFGPVDREWLEKELAFYETLQIQKQA